MTTIAAPHAAPSAESTEQLVDRWLAAWIAKDIDAIAACVHEDIRFTGPMLSLEGREAFLDSCRRILPMLLEFRPRAAFSGGERAMLVYDFVCPPPIGVCRTAELVTVRDGRVASIELFYDARPFETART